VNSLYWAWAATVADMWIFLSPAAYGTSLSNFFTVLVLHTVCCAILATVTYLLLPSRYKTPRYAVWALMFLFAFMAPFAGSLSLLFITRTTLFADRPPRLLAALNALDAVEFEVHAPNTGRSSQGSIRSRLAGEVPAPTRMKSLISLQAIPKRVANPLLENLLADTNDDVRMIAFGMLESEEKKLSALIHQERAQLKCALTSEQRFEALRHLAELHWELTYVALAQGEMRRYMLGEACRYIEEAMILLPSHDASTVYLRAKILLAQGEHGLAEQSMHIAAALGKDELSTLPYLAEIAFARHDLALAHEHMARLSKYTLTSRLKACVNLWTGCDQVQNFHDRSRLTHI
jgi:polysaccharide biosynthesis protein PelE